MIWRNPALAPSSKINVALGEKIRLLKGVGPIIVLFMMVTGVLFVGIATPVEAASLGAFGAMMFVRSEEHTSELQSLMRISYAVFCLKKKKINIITDMKTLRH